MFEHAPCVRLNRRAYSMPNRSVQRRMASCETAIPSGQHQLGDVTQAQTEAVVEPHTTTDDLRRESIAFVKRGSGRRLGHGGIRADRKRLDNASGAVMDFGDSLLQAKLEARAAFNEVSRPLHRERVNLLRSCVARKDG